jgi:hypothetical protein
MKKSLIIAMCCITVLFAACKKPVNPTPEPETVDYSAKYTGDFLGSFTLSISGTMSDTIPLSGLSFPFDSITMNIDHDDTFNSLVAKVTIDNEDYCTLGTASESKADFNSLHLNLNKPDFDIIGDIKLEATVISKDSLSLGGDFSGTGTIYFMGIQYPVDATGIVNGRIGRQ